MRWLQMVYLILFRCQCTKGLLGFSWKRGADQIFFLTLKPWFIYFDDRSVYAIYDTSVFCNQNNNVMIEINYFFLKKKREKTGRSSYSCLHSQRSKPIAGRSFLKPPQAVRKIVAHAHKKILGRVGFMG
jgi:hypothetical protein